MAAAFDQSFFDFTPKMADYINYVFSDGEWVNELDLDSADEPKSSESRMFYFLIGFISVALILTLFKIATNINRCCPKASR